MILLFQSSRIIASGGHAELYAGTRLYRTLFDQQSATGESPHS